MIPFGASSPAPSAVVVGVVAVRARGVCPTRKSYGSKPTAPEADSSGASAASASSVSARSASRDASRSARARAFVSALTSAAARRRST
ncbi:hypothetical protein GTW43_32305, partial [Streptomyces sp. SID5785]|uniref:hypothetical protein n=1 Tax=Streptomyces sp. SID5785 TaxID=2690309 RepID=UPI001360F2F1